MAALHSSRNSRSRSRNPCRLHQSRQSFRLSPRTASDRNARRAWRTADEWCREWLVRYPSVWSANPGYSTMSVSQDRSCNKCLSGDAERSRSAQLTLARPRTTAVAVWRQAPRRSSAVYVARRSTLQHKTFRMIENAGSNIYRVIPSPCQAKK